jgi:hypothetical protein
VSTIKCSENNDDILPSEQVVFSCHSVDTAAIEIQVILRKCDVYTTAPSENERKKKE